MGPLKGPGTEDVMMGGRFVMAMIVAGVALTAVPVVGERSFPPPPMPRRPPGFRIYCDVCEKMISRAVPFCQRQEENMDYLTDFCTYNYNSVLRPECDFITNVMDYVWCPNACSQVRKLVWFSGEAICKHKLVNCTERNPYPTPVPSPSPSASMPLSPDCALCEYTLKSVAEMCMNDETANKAAIYQVCMTKTTNTRDFDSCTEFLGELVAIAGTRDPCEMLSCEEPKVACKQDESLECHVSEYTQADADAKGVMGLDADGNIIKPTRQKTLSLSTRTFPAWVRATSNPVWPHSTRARQDAKTRWGTGCQLYIPTRSIRRTRWTT